MSNQCCTTCVVSASGQEKVVSESDTDSGKGTMTSYSSTNSLNSTGSLSGAGTDSQAAPLNSLGGIDSPQQFEVLKQQKDIWEMGIEL